MQIFSPTRLASGGLAVASILVVGWATTAVGHAVPITTDEYSWTSANSAHRLVIPGVATAGEPQPFLFAAASPLASDGYFGYPLASWSAVTDRFGLPRERGKIHTGIDIALADSVPVYAACDGIVSVSAQSEIAGTEGYGNHVIIRCNADWTTLYAHLSRTAVKEGEDIVRGWPIGLSGSTGFSMGQHLHFEIRYRGAFVDPELYLDFGAPPRETPAVAELSAELPIAVPTIGDDPPTPTEVSATETPTTSPTETPEPTGTPAPEPSATVAPSPAITPIPGETSTPAPSATPTPSPAPTESAAPTPSPAASPTATPTGDIYVPIS